MDVSITFKTLKEWVDLYGDGLVGAVTHIPSASGRFNDGATIKSVNSMTVDFRSSGPDGSTGFSNIGDLQVGIYQHSLDKIPKPDFIRSFS